MDQMLYIQRSPLKLSLVSYYLSADSILWYLSVHLNPILVPEVIKSIGW